MRTLGRVWLCLVVFFAPLAGTYAQDIVQVAVHNTDSTLLMDQAGVPLTSGGSADGDGALLQLGFYTKGTADDPFDGLFVPLTGMGQSSAPGRKTSIGDSEGGADGRFSLVFHNVGMEQAFGQQLPSPGTPLVLRFFSTPSIGNLTLYNEVSGGAAWGWQRPSLFPGTLLFLSLLDAPLVWKDGPGSAFRTTMGYAPATINLQPLSQSADSGADVELKVAASGFGPISYQWRRAGVPIPGAVGAELRLKTLDVGQAGLYDVVVSNSFGSAVSAPAVLTVNGVMGSLLTTQPRNVKTLRGSKATLSLALAPESDQVVVTTYQLHRFNNQGVGGAISGSTGTVSKDGGLQLPLGGITESGQYVVRFRRVFRSHTAEFDSLPFSVETDTWTNMAASYQCLLVDSDNALQDGAGFRGLVSFTVTRSGGVSARLTYVEAPLVPDNRTHRAYLPVNRSFSGAFKPVPDAPSKFVFNTSRAGVASRQELNVEMDCSATAPQLVVSVRDFVSLSGSTYVTRAGECVANATKATLPANPPSGRFVLQSEDRAQFRLRTTALGLVVWNSVVGGVAGTGSSALRVNQEGLLSAIIGEKAAKNSPANFSTRAVFGSLYFTRAQPDQQWKAAIGSSKIPGALEQQLAYVPKNKGVLAWNQAFENVNGVSPLRFTNENFYAWNLGSAFESGGALHQTKQFLLTVEDPSNTQPAPYQWKVSFLGSGVAKTEPVSNAAGLPPTLMLRLDKLSGAFSGGYMVPADKIRRTLVGAGRLDTAFSAWGWTDRGAAPFTLSADWSLAPVQSP